MSRYVVAANVPGKWFIPEVLSTEAFGSPEGQHRLIAPDLVYAEAGKTRSGRKYSAAVCSRARHATS